MSDKSELDLLVTFYDDDRLAAYLADPETARTLPPDLGFGLALGLIERLRSKVRVLEATAAGRFLGEDAAE